MGCRCLYLCSYLRSCCEVTARFLVSPEESIRRKRRLVWGIAVLLLVDVLWVGSSELTDVSVYFSLDCFKLVVVPLWRNDGRMFSCLGIFLNLSSGKPNKLG